MNGVRDEHSKDVIYERKCPICQKSFIKAPLHIYKDKRSACKAEYVCSYHCMLKSEKLAEQEAKDKYRARKQRMLEKKLISKQ